MARFFHDLVGVVLGSGLAACGGSVSAPTQAEDAGDPLGPDDTCSSPAYAATPLSDAQIPSTVDYAEERFQGLPGDSIRTVGTACKTASTPTTCQAALAALSPKSGFPHDPSSPPTYVAYTRGDEVGAITTNAEFVSILGPIDRRARASILAELNFHTNCSCLNMTKVDGGFTWSETMALCDGTNDQQNTVWKIATDGTISQLSSTRVTSPDRVICGTGRRPEGFAAAARAPDATPVGKFLVEVAELEAASVFAFERLRDELMAHGAPKRLVRAAERAIRDEIRHARVMARHAARYGAKAPVVSAPRLAVRGLEEIAIDNATEGCVRETYGAIVATWQAKTAKDRALARSMCRIARDETKHAALSWEIAAWIDSRLSRAARARVRAARDEVLLALKSEVGGAQHPEVTARAGAPAPRDAVALLDAASALWAA
jgi:hypothetical protein